MLEVHALIDHAKSYVLANPVCKKHGDTIIRRVSCFVNWATQGSQETEPVPLSANLLNGYLAFLETINPPLSPFTINGYRANILAVWSYVLDMRIPWKIRRIKRPQLNVDGWTLEEIDQLCMTADTLVGVLPNGVTRRLLMLTAIHCGFSTALRYGDLKRVKVKQIRTDRTCDILQNKTKKLVTVKFSARAMELIAEHGRENVLPNPHSQEWFCGEFRNLVKQAGIRTGTHRFLRRVAGSLVDDKTGRGPELLGNTRTVFNQSYNVREITRREPPEPPTLGKAG